MPESEPEHATERHPGELNDAQQRRLRVTCQYIDKLLSDIESVLHATASKSPFPRYIVDITPAQSRVIEDHIHRLRSQLLRTLAWQHMEPTPPEIPAIRAVMTDLAFIDIAIEELKPNYLQGYGPVPDDAVGQLNGVVQELRSLVEGMERYVRQGLGTHLEARQKKLEETGCDVDLLRLLEQVITRAPIDTEVLEERLRQATGMIGEQRATLNYAFLKLGETPDEVLSQVADTTLQWMRTNSETRVTSSQLSEWIHDAVRLELEQSIGNIGWVSQRAIDTLQSVAREKGRTDMPTQEEMATLLRDMPRFEMAALPNEIGTSHWTFLGDGVVRSKIKKLLREDIGEVLQRDFHLYGRALSQWNQPFANKMEFLIRSYADAYGVQLHRITGTSDESIDTSQVEDDLRRLTRWETDRSVNVPKNMDREA